MREMTRVAPKEEARMQMGRLAWGVVAGIVGLTLVAVTYAVETRVFGSPSRLLLFVAFFGGGGAVLWLADRWGLMIRPYSSAALGLADVPPTPPANTITIHIDLAKPCAARLAELANAAGIRATAQGTQVVLGASTIAVSVTIENHGRIHGKSMLAIAVHAHVPHGGSPLTSGSIGLGDDDADAVATAIDEWATSAGLPIANAVVGEAVATTRLGPFSVYPGPVGIRGPLETPPTDIGTSIVQHLADAATKLDPRVWHAISVKAAVAPDSIDIECRIDREVSEASVAALKQVLWPQATSPYLFSQFYVLRPPVQR